MTNMTSPLAYASYTERRPSPRRLRNCSLVLLTTLLLVVGAKSASEALSSSSFTSTNRNGMYSPLGKNGKSLNGKVFNGKLKPLLQGDLPDRVVGADYIADTKLPTAVGNFKMRAYRVKQMDLDHLEEESEENFLTYRNNQGMEPIVIYHAENPPFGTSKKLAHDVPIRIHDQCLTSEVFGSQRCDCSEQLKLSLEYVRDNGGAIIYLQQEGRGIGLANKVAAYELQDMGFDTVDANLHLGFPEDCRQYGMVPSLLEEMNIGSIKLLTNNPRKVERLTSLGISVSDTLPIIVPKVNDHNRKYLETKKDRMNHQNFGSLLENTDAIVNRRDASTDAANAVEVSMLLEDSTTATPGVGHQASPAFAPVYDNDILDDESQAGVTASQDGYCFGRESVEDVIDAVARGEMVVVVDDMDRENEGDLIMAADLCTPMDMAKIVRYSSGVICVGMEGARMDELKLPAMCTNNEDPKGTAFSVTVDASKSHGITTGISAGDRSKTVQLLANPEAKAVDFNRPGHLFPLRARDGGVLARDGHTEAAVDLSRLAGRSPCGVLCEIVSEDNPTEMMRLPELKRFCRRHGFKMTSIVDLAQYRREIESVIAKSHGNQ